MDLKNATYRRKEPVPTIPNGAIIIRKDIDLRIEEIENGFLVRKEFNIEFKIDEESSKDYLYYSKSWFCKENPLTINEKIMNKSLADNFK